MQLECSEIVKKLDKFIIGQDDAKKAVAVALRNRYRRSVLPEEIRQEITPRNIIMKGPTGVGKTEIARRLAKLVNAPFIKVEATKYTEVGYVGRDVESMIRDLAEVSVRMVKTELMSTNKEKAENIVENKLFDIIYPVKKLAKDDSVDTDTFKAQVRKNLTDGKYDNDIVEIKVKEQPKQLDIMSSGGNEINIGQIVGGMFGSAPKRNTKVSLGKARMLMIDEECEKLLDKDYVNAEAIRRAEQDGIIFIDEIDKIANKRAGGQDVSREGVQRDILPIVEGSTVTTKYGVIRTEYILFIAAGAFHLSAIEDLIPELQGRFPVRVNLNSLNKEDLKLILTVPENAITEQYKHLLKVDNVNLTFTPEAIDEIADLAAKENETKENIGARRLQTIMESLLEEILFYASDKNPVTDLCIDKPYVIKTLSSTLQSYNYKKYVL